MSNRNHSGKREELCHKLDAWIRSDNSPTKIQNLADNQKSELLYKGEKMINRYINK